MDTIKKLTTSKSFGGANNAMSVLSNIASLGSSINSLNTAPSSDTMTGQEMAQQAAKKEGQVASGTIATIVSIIGMVLACL